MKKVYSAKDITEAHIVAGMLNAHGIKTFVTGEHLQGGIGELVVADFAKVMVADDDMSQGRKIICDYEGKENFIEESEYNTPDSKESPTLIMIAVISITIICLFLIAP